MWIRYYLFQCYVYSVCYSYTMSVLCTISKHSALITPYFWNYNHSEQKTYLADNVHLKRCMPLGSTTSFSLLGVVSHACRFVSFTKFLICLPQIVWACHFSKCDDL